MLRLPWGWKHRSRLFGDEEMGVLSLRLLGAVGASLLGVTAFCTRDGACQSALSSRDCVAGR